MVACVAWQLSGDLSVLRERRSCEEPGRETTGFLAGSPLAEIFFGTTFRPSFVTVHKCDGRDLGSISLKMAAGSILNGAVKYVYPDRHFVGGKRTNKLHSGKRQENLVYRSSRCYSYSRNLKECGHQKVVPKHVDNTASDILGPLWSERNLIQFNLVS